MLDARSTGIQTRPQGRENAGEDPNFTTWDTSLPRPNWGTGNVSMVNKLLSCKGVLRSHVHPSYRPTDRHGQKIHPSRFAAYRETHEFLYPCCLCAAGDRYVEAAIFQQTEGTGQGQYVAECATSKCGYMRKLASLQELLTADLQFSECGEICRKTLRASYILPTEKYTRSKS
jgi:hypothetical protein